MCLRSLRLLLRERSPKLELYRELINTQVLLDPGAISAYRACIEYGASLRKLMPAAAAELEARCKGGNASMYLGLAQREEMHRSIKGCADMCVAATKSADHMRVAAENKETVRRACVHLLVVQLLERCLDPARPGQMIDFYKQDSPGNTHTHTHAYTYTHAHT